MDIDEKIIDYINDNQNVSIDDIYAKFKNIQKDVIIYHVKIHKPELLESDNSHVNEESEEYQFKNIEKSNARRETIRILDENPGISNDELCKKVHYVSPATVRGYRSQYFKSRKKQSVKNENSHGILLSELEKKASKSEQKIKTKNSDQYSDDMINAIDNMRKLFLFNSDLHNCEEIKTLIKKEIDKKIELSRVSFDKTINEKISNFEGKILDNIADKIQDYIEPLIRKIIDKIIAEKINDFQSKIIGKLISGVMSNIDLNINLGGKK